MHEPPSGPELLEAARKTLLDELLPALPAEKRYPALMVANAIAIAARTARHDPAPADALAAEARGVTGTDEAEPWRALAAAIRAGRFDPGTDGHDRVHALLRAYAEARCAISSPKARRGQAG